MMARKKIASKRPNFIARNTVPLAIIGSIAGTMGGTYLGLDAYVRHAWDNRYSLANQYLQSQSETPVKREPFGLKYDASLLYRVHVTDSNFERRLPGFVEFIRKNVKDLEGLTSFPYERNGIIEESNGSFKIISRDQDKISAISYIDEILRGDFTNKAKLQNYIQEYPVIFQLEDIGVAAGHVIAGINAMETYSQINSLPPDLRNDFGAYQKGDSRPISLENLQKANDMIAKHLKWVREIRLVLSSWTVADWDMINDKNLFARFHTHPIEDKNYDPSKPDIGQTKIMGPNILFSQTGKVLHVYAIHNGAYREIFKEDLPKN